MLIILDEYMFTLRSLLARSTLWERMIPVMASYNNKAARTSYTTMLIIIDYWPAKISGWRNFSIPISK
jgi:hypothetical protein